MKNSCFKFLAALLIYSITCLPGCASVSYREERGDYEKKINRLQTELQKNPANEETLQELGVIYFKIGEYALSKEMLAKAFQINPRNPKTLFYLGMNLEFSREEDKALKVYQRYTDFSRLSPYRGMMEGRYHWLTREKIRQEMLNALAAEGALPVDSLSRRTVAVFPLAYQGSDSQFAALGRGLSEMMIIDLGRISDLKLVERVRLEVLLQEIAGGQAGLFDPQTAPRTGKLLSAGRIIQGNYQIFDKDQLRVDIASLDVPNGQFSNPISGTDALANLFKIEKELVFQTVAEMGIELTPEEQRKIQFIPTQNLQAFLAYTMGLEDESAGRFAQAAGHYHTAAQMDGDFTLAALRAEYAGSLNDAGGSREEAAHKAEALEKSLETPGGKELAKRRLQQLANNLGSNFIPGPDGREGAEEAAAAGVNLLPENLPDPPNPPTEGR